MTIINRRGPGSQCDERREERERERETEAATRYHKLPVSNRKNLGGRYCHGIFIYLRDRPYIATQAFLTHLSIYPSDVFRSSRTYIRLQNFVSTDTMRKGVFSIWHLWMSLCFQVKAGADSRPRSSSEELNVPIGKWGWCGVSKSRNS